MRAWTLGYPPAYERAIRIPGNAKAPGGYVFRTKKAALEHARTHDDAVRYRPYRIELPGRYEDETTNDYQVAALARHDWHLDQWITVMPTCGVCIPRPQFGIMDHDLLLVAAPFVNPDR